MGWEQSHGGRDWHAQVLDNFHLHRPPMVWPSLGPTLAKCPRQQMAFGAPWAGALVGCLGAWVTLRFYVRKESDAFFADWEGDGRVTQRLGQISRLLLWFFRFSPQAAGEGMTIEQVYQSQVMLGHFKLHVRRVKHHLEIGTPLVMVNLMPSQDNSFLARDIYILCSVRVDGKWSKSPKHCWIFCFLGTPSFANHDMGRNAITSSWTPVSR